MLELALVQYKLIVNKSAETLFPVKASDRYQDLQVGSVFGRHNSAHNTY